MDELLRTNRKVTTVSLLGLVSAVPLVLASGCANYGLPGGSEGRDDTRVGTERRHDIIFTQVLARGYEGTDSCLSCHSKQGEDLLATAHWKWSGTSDRIEGHQNETHGKVDLLNNL
jgi:hypothetical protein